MSDQVFKLVVRTYRNAKKTISTSVRFFGKEFLLFRLFGIPVCLDALFFLLAILPLTIVAGSGFFRGYGAPIDVLLSFLLIPIFLFAAFLSILIHELGHAFFVRRNQFRVDQIFISACYGLCRFSYPSDVVPPISIAWGGILTQVLFCILLIGCEALFFPTDDIAIGVGVLLYVRFFIAMLLLHNVWMIVINLLPVPGLDGELIWGHVGYLWRTRSK